MAGHIPRSFIDDLLARLDIVDIIDARVKLKKKGKNYGACCPFHNEKTPSFYVSPSKEIFKCFSSGKGGDAISFIMEVEGINYIEALKYLAQKYGIEVEEEEMTETPVLIAGGGPVGLVLALELEHRGIDAILVERNPTTTRHPKMDVTNGRSMELFRRLGIADEIRSHAVPSDHPMTVVWVTRAGEWELARFDYPSIDWGRDIIGYE